MKQNSSQAMAAEYAFAKPCGASLVHSAQTSRLISGLLLTAMAFVSWNQKSQAAGFSNTGSMEYGRVTPGAVLLPNGKVLVVGGTSPASSSAEIYDPATGNWTSTGDMITARSSAPTILLSNGKVLVAGGQGLQNVTLSAAEIYDPATGKWSSTGALNTPRITQAVLLSNGKALMSGGSGNGGLSSCELYDRGTGKWTLTGALSTGRSAISVVLSNGKVLIAGGANNGNHLSSSELYDAASGKWTAGTSLGGTRNAHTMTLLSNGNILVAGGLNFHSSGVPYSLSSVEVYNASTRAWLTTDDMSVERTVHSATLLKNGRVLVAGGYSYSSSPTRHTSAELYDPQAGTWTPAGNLNTGRNAHRGILLQNGKVLVLGGFDSANTYLSSAELYDPGDASTPTPSATAKASYNGLFYPSGGVTQQSSGFCTIMTTVAGRFSAKLSLSGKTYSVSGKLATDGPTSVPIQRKGLSLLTLIFQIDANQNEITGSISDGSWSAQLLADRPVFNAKTNPAPNGGKYTMVIPGAATSSSKPGGHGVGTVTIDGSGKVKFSGILGDGTKVSQSAILSPKNQWPLYVSLYKGNGSLVSWITFAEESSSSLKGNLSWIKAGSIIKGIYPQGFTNQITAIGSVYNSLIGTTWGLSYADGKVVLKNGNLNGSLSNDVMLSGNTLVTSSGSATKFILKRTPASGLLKGSFIHPATGKKSTITGVILQKQNNARGFFIGTNESGAFSLDAN